MAVRRQVAAQFARESARLTAVLRAAADSGASPATALRTLLESVPAGAPDWQRLFTEVLTSIGQQAGQRLINQWAQAGLLPRGATTYDPTRAGSQVANVLAQGLPQQAAESVISTTQAALDGTLSTGIDASEIDDLITSLRQQYSAWQQSGGRVATIADTQVVGGWSLGELDSAFQAHNVTGAHATRTWNAVLDAHTRPDHAAADGQTVGLNEPFDVGGESLMYPGDPSGSAGNIINCRCGTSYSLSLDTSDTDDTGVDSADDSGE